MALTGGHVAGAGDHVGDHNLIDARVMQLSNVENTSDAAKPVSNATRAALDLKLSVVAASTTYATQSNLDLKQSIAGAAATYAPLVSPIFTGAVIGVTKAAVGLGVVDNTSDSAKPISTAQAAALNLKQKTIKKYATQADAQADLAAGNILDGDLIVILT